jgi:hypothetical protein
MTPSDKEFAP